MGEREKVIAQIEALYPADSVYPMTSAIGIRLLRQARDDFNDWRDEPIAVLRRYADLCQQSDRLMISQAERNMFVDGETDAI